MSSNDSESSRSGGLGDVFLENLRALPLAYEQESKKSLEDRREDIRSWTTLGVVGAYFLCILVICVAGVWTISNNAACVDNTACAGIVAALGRVTEYVHMLAAPVVMLVLGFYFGNNHERK
ncbi:MAG: hypothetical protein H6862_06510 [Rhodospirillales bacterium]|nr:hypothetical protein [Rhodospirillales bacterium]